MLLIPGDRLTALFQSRHLSIHFRHSLLSIYTYIYITDAFLFPGALLSGEQLNQATRYPQPKYVIRQMQLAMYSKHRSWLKKNKV